MMKYLVRRSRRGFGCNVETDRSRECKTLDLLSVRQE
jgi:hypothetical protein